MIGRFEWPMMNGRLLNSQNGDFDIQLKTKIITFILRYVVRQLRILHCAATKDRQKEKDWGLFFYSKISRAVGPCMWEAFG